MREKKEYRLCLVSIFFKNLSFQMINRWPVSIIEREIKNKLTAVHMYNMMQLNVWDEIIRWCLQNLREYEMSYFFWKSIDIWAICTDDDGQNNEIIVETHSTITLVYNFSNIFKFVLFFFLILNQNIVWTMISRSNNPTTYFMLINFLFIISLIHHFADAQGTYFSVWFLVCYLVILHVVCTPDVCNKHGTCIPNALNSFTCRCDPGFAGQTCNEGSLLKIMIFRRKNNLQNPFFICLYD